MKTHDMLIYSFLSSVGAKYANTLTLLIIFTIVTQLNSYI